MKNTRRTIIAFLLVIGCLLKASANNPLKKLSPMERVSSLIVGTFFAKATHHHARLTYLLLTQALDSSCLFRVLGKRPTQLLYLLKTLGYAKIAVSELTLGTTGSEYQLPPTANKLGALVYCGTFVAAMFEAINNTDVQGRLGASFADLYVAYTFYKAAKLKNTNQQLPKRVL